MKKKSSEICLKCGITRDWYSAHRGHFLAKNCKIEGEIHLWGVNRMQESFEDNYF